MRVLFYSDYKEDKSRKDVLSFLKKDRLSFVDFTNDLDEAEYCLYVRSYDLIIIDSRKEQVKLSTFLKLINENNDKHKSISLIFNETECLEEYIKSYIKFDFKIIDSIYKTKEEIKEIYPNILKYRSGVIKLDESTRRIKFNINNKEEWITFSAIEFALMVYFIRHNKEKIHVDRLMSAISKEPEIIKKTAVETAISRIKKNFISAFDFTPIENYKKVGYMLQ